VHGAMCISYSGRCLLSNFLTGRDANQGACTHPCRWKYSLVEETRPGEYMPVEENERGTFIFNSKDLCMIDHLPDLIEAGIDSFKIEGRMKTALYVATVARTYRKAIDDYFEDPALYEKNREWYRDEIGKCTFRDYTTRFFYGKPGTDAQIYDASTYVTNYIYIGTVMGTDEKGYAVFTQKNKFLKGDTVEIMKANGETLFTVAEEILNDAGEQMESAPHASETLHVKFSVMPEKYEILRQSVKDDEGERERG